MQQETGMALRGMSRIELRLGMSYLLNRTRSTVMDTALAFHRGGQASCRAPGARHPRVARYAREFPPYRQMEDHSVDRFATGAESRAYVYQHPQTGFRGRGLTGGCTRASSEEGP